MSKLNASKIKERLRQVPPLKIIFLKELKCMDLYRSLVKTDCHNFIILLFFYLYRGSHDLQRWNLQNKVAISFLYLRVPPQGPTLGSHLRVLGPGSHLRALGLTFPVCLDKYSFLDTISLHLSNYGNFTRSGWCCHSQIMTPHIIFHYVAVSEGTYLFAVPLTD